MKDVLRIGELLVVQNHKTINRKWSEFGCKGTVKNKNTLAYVMFSIILACGDCYVPR